MTNLGRSNLTRLKAIIDKFKIDLNSVYKKKKNEEEEIKKEVKQQETSIPLGLEIKTTKREDIGKEEDELTPQQKKQILEVASINRALEKEPSKEELDKRKDDIDYEKFKRIKDSLPPLVSDRQEELEKMKLDKLKEIAKKHKIKTNSKMKKDDFIDEILKKEGIERGFRTPGREYFYKDLYQQHFCADKFSMGGLPQLLYRQKILKVKLEKAKSENDQKEAFRLISDLADTATKIEECEKVLRRDIKKEYEKEVDEYKKATTPLSADEVRLLKTYKKELDKMDMMKKQGINMNEDMRPEILKIINDLERRLRFYGAPGIEPMQD